jgi:stage II sporulation protein D
MTKEEFINKIKAVHTDFEINFDDGDAIQVKEMTDSNRVKTIKIGNLELAGVEVRTILGLRSASFTFEIDGNNIKFSVIGYGHGVGMSQTGADALAKQGYSYEDIINHFYTGVEIINL